MGNPKESLSLKPRVKLVFVKNNGFTSRDWCLGLTLDKSALHLKDFARTRLNDSQLLVFAGGRQQAAIGIEGHAEDDICVTIYHLHGLSNVQVPYQNLREMGQN